MKFRYGDKVVLEEGFYKGQTSPVLETRKILWLEREYRVDPLFGVYMWVKESSLKRQDEDSGQ